MRTEDWFKHEKRSRLDLKMRALLARYGWQGYGFFWAIVEHLYDDNQHALPAPSEDSVEWQTMARDGNCHLPMAIEMANACVALRLFESDGARLWSERVFRETRDRGANPSRLSAVRAAAGRRGADKRWGKSAGLMATADGKMANMAERERGERSELSPKGDSSDPTSNGGAAGPRGPLPTLTPAEKRQLLADFGVDACRHYVPLLSDIVSQRAEPVEDFAGFVRSCMAHDRAERRGFYDEGEEGQADPGPPAPKNGGPNRHDSRSWTPPYMEPGFKLASPDEVRAAMARFHARFPPAKPARVAGAALSGAQTGNGPARGEISQPGPDSPIQSEHFEQNGTPFHDGGA